MLFAELQANIQPQLSRLTILHYLKKNNIHKWLAKGHTRLKDEHKKAQYKWAYEHYHWLKKNWEKVIWSNEYMVE